ncbi:MAG: 3-hydroxyacyl-CoA dehydrogenase family protein [Eubacterium sp.]|jgi:3-hydroxyacyl-CoA dehydrogenase|nr:3-hydroxyacyl-CoA dehydrogenase family protein [Eubacterium sp.]
MSEKKKVAVLGAGKMGLGIAQLFATKGHEVKVIYVYDDKTRYDSREVIRQNLNVLVRDDVLKENDVPEILGRIDFVDTIEDTVGFADIVFEGIIEKLEIKQDYFAKMDALFPESTILATNTSAISVTEIAEKSVHKERIIGTHYWNPAYLIPLVEVVKTKYVSEETVKATYGLLEEAGKKPVIVKKDVPGFLANRMQHALFREALSIVEHDIADPEDVDKAIKYGFGMRLGICPPIEVMDMGGLDLTYAIHEYLFPHIENSTTPSRLLTENIEKGNLGFKSGKGIMDWPKESIEKANKELIDGLIKVAKALDRL